MTIFRHVGNDQIWQLEVSSMHQTFSPLIGTESISLVYLSHQAVCGWLRLEVVARKTRFAPKPNFTMPPLAPGCMYALTTSPNQPQWVTNNSPELCFTCFPRIIIRPSPPPTTIVPPITVFSVTWHCVNILFLSSKVQRTAFEKK